MEKKHIRIYVSPMGCFRENSAYEFVAEFESEKLVTYYVSYMRKRRRYADKDIIVQEVTVTETEAGEITKKGKVVGVIAVTGECLELEEWFN